MGQKLIQSYVSQQKETSLAKKEYNTRKIHRLSLHDPKKKATSNNWQVTKLGIAPRTKLGSLAMDFYYVNC